MLPVCFLMLTVLFVMLSPPPFMLRGAGGRGGGAFMTRLFFNADRSFFYAPLSLSYAARARLGAAGGGGRGARAIELALFLRVK